MMRICLVVIAAMFTVAQASAQEQSPESIPEGVVNAHPVVSVERVDFETLRARRIDVVDSQGVIRLTLAGELPNPVVDGVELDLRLVVERERESGAHLCRYERKRLRCDEPQRGARRDASRHGGEPGARHGTEGCTGDPPREVYAARLDARTGA